MLETVLKVVGAGKGNSKFIFTVAKGIASTSNSAMLDKSRSKIIRSKPHLEVYTPYKLFVSAAEIQAFSNSTLEKGIQYSGVKGGGG